MLALFLFIVHKLNGIRLSYRSNLSCSLRFCLNRISCPAQPQTVKSMPSAWYGIVYLLLTQLFPFLFHLPQCFIFVQAATGNIDVTVVIALVKKNGAPDFYVSSLNTTCNLPYKNSHLSPFVFFFQQK